MVDEYHLRELKVEVNRDCPLNCIHCSSNGCPHAPEQLNRDQVSGIIMQFAEMGGKEVCISGGEPLNYASLPEIIRKCREVKVKTTIYTSGISSNNGTLSPISDKIVDLLATNQVRTIFSIHGSCKKIHESVTQTQGSFDTTVTAIKKVIKAHLKAEAHVVPMTLNFGDLELIVKLVDSLGIHKMSLLRFVPQGRGQLNRNILQLNKEEMTPLSEKITELRQKFTGITIRTGAPYNILFPQVPASCEAGISILTIRPDGIATPCDAFKRFEIDDAFCDVTRKALSDIWQNSQFLNAVRKIKVSSTKSACSPCLLYNRCNSGCLAQKAICFGSLTDGQDPECPLTRIQGRDVEHEAMLV